MIEIAVGSILIVAAVFAAFKWGGSSEKKNTAEKTASTVKEQAKIAAKPRKRTAKGVAEDIKKRGI